MSLGCVTVAVILLTSPAAYRRTVLSEQEAEEVDRVGSWFVTCADASGLRLAGDVYVFLIDVTTSPRIGASIGGVAFVFLVGLWHVFPVVVRLPRDQ
jgi:hypothetical protein